jgi:plasmid stabilization system protein ParE
MSYTVVFAPLAEEQLAELYRYIAEQASPETAARYTEAIVACCERLSNFPHRGAARDDIRPGLRITNYKGRTVIAFGVDDASNCVSILGVYYGGQDYEYALGLEPDDE